MTRICCGQPMVEDTTSRNSVSVLECTNCRLVAIPTPDNVTPIRPIPIDSADRREREAWDRKDLA
jgi:hypothetical protein